jgi:hypothetical protein
MPKDHRYTKVSLDAMFDATGFEPASDEPSVEEIVEHNMLMEQLTKALLKLTETERKLIEAYYFQHKTERQIATENGIARTNTSCGKCPPDNRYRILGNVAYGSVVGGSEFVIDSEDLPKVEKHQWHMAQGYIVASNKSGNIKLHRLILGLEDEGDVDHINGNTLDNRKCNLRVCTHQQNMWNMKKPKTNTTGYKGVCLRKRYGFYTAGMRINGRNTHLGVFSSAIDAAIAYDKAALAHRGEFARTNFPREYYVDA